MSLIAAITQKQLVGEPLSDSESLLLANRADQETQNARLQALDGKTCLWITAPVIPMMSGVLEERVRWVTSQGVKVVAVFHSKEDKLYDIMTNKGLYSTAIFADLRSKKEGNNILDVVQSSGLIINSVFSPYEQCQTIVGEVATKLGLHGNSGEAYTIARSKDKTREACRKYGLPTPRSGVAATMEELIQILDHVQYPAILKPSSGAGSAGVFRANNLDDAQKAFSVIMSDVECNNNLNWNPGVARNACLVEELLVGAEFDVDVLLWDSKPMYVQSVDNWDCIPPYFLETGSNMPSLYPRDKLDILEKYAVDCVLACGFTYGCFHVECMYTEDGPRLIEVNARQGGGSMQEFNLGMHDVDIFANFFIGTFGIPINPPVTPQKYAMADYSITCSKTGKVKDLDFFAKIQQHPNVVRCTAFVKVGDNVIGFDTGFPVWLGEFLVKGESAQHCVDLINQIMSDSQINIEPTSSSGSDGHQIMASSDAPIDKPSGKIASIASEPAPQDETPVSSPVAGELRPAIDKLSVDDEPVLNTV